MSDVLSVASGNVGRKAATIITTLGAEKASKIYKHLDESDIRKITIEVSKLGTVELEEREQTLKEFYKFCLTKKSVAEGGYEYAKAILERAFGEEEAADMLGKVSKFLKNRTFGFMNSLDEKSLQLMLQGERPQTIALILAYLDPEAAARVLIQLGDEESVQVIESIAQMEGASTEVVQLVETQMYKKLETVMHTGETTAGGISHTAAVMNFMDRRNEKIVFDELDKHNPDLATEIRKRMFVFEDISKMDPRSIQRFVRDCDTKDIVYALKGSTPEMSEVFFANMSSRMAESIRDDLEVLHNVRLSDVEQAQQTIVSKIRSLEEAGELMTNKAGKGDVIA